jgi:excisionase family DNA binding protein
MKQIKAVTDWDSLPVVMDLPLAARVLGLSFDNVKKKAQQGRIPAFKIGESWRVSRDSLQRFITQKEAEQ